MAGPSPQTQPPVDLSDWQPEPSFGADGDCDCVVVAQVDHGRHFAIGTQALGKDGLWHPVPSPLLIHAAECYERFRQPLLLRVVLYGQASPD